MKKLEEKLWHEYTNEEQETLLIHWFRYYGKSIFSDDEFEKYFQMVKNNRLEVLALATIDYITEQQGPTFILQAIRYNKVKELWGLLESSVNLLEKSPEKSIEFKKMQEQFLKMIVNSYNNPEPDISMDEATIIKQVMELYNASVESNLNSSYILSLIMECSMGNAPFISSWGLINNYNFSEQVLEEKKQIIAKLLISMGINLKNSICLEDLIKKRDGNYWNTMMNINDIMALDGLLALSVASGFILNNNPRMIINFSRLDRESSMQFEVNKELIEKYDPGEPSILIIKL